MAKLVLTGDGRGAVKAVRDLNKELAGTAKASVLTAKEAAKVVRQAKSIGEAADPLKKYNRLMKELAEHVRQGRVSMQDASRMAATYRQRLEGVGKAGNKAYGPDVIASIGKMATGYMSMSVAVGTVTRSLQELSAERIKAAQADIGSRGGLAQLAQLAATAKNPQAKMKALLTEARSYRTSGAVATEGEGGELLFSLSSAGLGPTDRAFAAKMKVSGVLQDPAAAAKGFSALTTNLGAAEVGNFEGFISKALAASRIAPATGPEIALAASGSGGSAKALGVTDESLLAATGILASATGSAEMGGTQLKAFLKGAEVAGLKTNGKGLLGLIDQISAMPEDQQGFGGVLGKRAEGIAAFRTLRDNREQLAGLRAEVDASQNNNLARLAVGLPSADVQIQAANRVFASRGRREVGLGGEAAAGNQLESMRNNAAARRREEGTVGGEVLNAIENIGNKLNEFFGVSNIDALRMAVNQPTTPQSVKDEGNELLRQIEQNQSNGNPQGRQE